MGSCTADKGEIVAKRYRQFGTNVESDTQNVNDAQARRRWIRQDFTALGRFVGQQDARSEVGRRRLRRIRNQKSEI